MDFHRFKKIKVIPSLLPIPEDIFNEKLPEHIEELLQRFTINICSIGAFIPQYGFNQIAEAVERLRNEESKDIGLIFIAGTFACDNEFRKKLLSNRPWISVLCDLPHPQVLQLLKHCSIFIRATKEEGLGLSRVEALWCGTPVITTNTGETRGMLTFEYGNIDGLVQIINKILEEQLHPEVSEWANFYKQMANKNLESFLDLIKLFS